MELSKAIRTGYFGALSGNVTLNGKAVPVFDAFPLQGIPYPYIILSSQTSGQRAIKTGRIYSATMLVDIVTGDTSPMGRAQSEDIAEQIEEIVNPTTNQDIDITHNGYTIADTEREEDSNIESKNGQYYIYRKLLRYRHQVEKL